MSNMVKVESKHLEMLIKSEAQIQAAMGSGGDAKRFLRVCQTEFRANPKLALCSPESFMLSVFEGARLGLEIGAQLGQYYFIPRANEVVPMLGYRGMIALGLRHPDVQTITSTPVYKGDYFESGENMQGQYFEYKPCGNKKAEELEKAFAVCRLKNGGVILEVMEREQIEAARAKSKMPNGQAWRDSYSEMARKTVVRRLFKYIPLVAEASEAIARDEDRWEAKDEVRQPQKYQAALKEAERIRIEETIDITPGDDKMDKSQNENGDKHLGGTQA